jgi:hypothetical protein
MVVSNISSIKRGATPVTKIYQGSNLIWPKVTVVTPTAPILAQDDVANTISASHPNYPISEIEVMGADTYYAPYTETISVGNVDQPAGYWKFRIKAAPGRNAGAVASSAPFTSVATNTTPLAPTIIADDTANTIDASSSQYPDSEILISINNNSYIQFDGNPISVGNIDVPAGYYKFKIKSATGRNESPVASSPAFNAVIVSTGTNYTLLAPATTSGGIFKKDGTLVRTLWNNEKQTAGTYPIVWDGTDDFKQTLPVQDYDAKVVVNNVQYTMEGYIGNTSTALYEKDKRHRTLDPLTSIEIVGNTGYYSVGYNEGNGSIFPFSLSTPQEKTNPWQNYGIQFTEQSCTDGNYIYWDVVPAYQAGLSAIYATKVSDNSIVNFSAGSSFAVQYGYTYPGAIATLDSFREQTFTYNGGPKTFTLSEDIPYHLNTVTTPAKGEVGFDPFDQNQIAKSGFVITVGTPLNVGDQVKIKWWRLESVSAMAVNSNYLFIARYNTSFIEVRNKLTGAFVRTVPGFSNISAMTVEISSNTIWIAENSTTVRKFPINSDGTLGGSSVTLSGNLSNVIDLKVGNGQLVLVDAGTNQQVKGFNLSNGSLTWTLGQVGGNLQKPLVANDTFAFFMIEEYEGLKISRGGVAIGPDGGLWIADGGNRRILHYDSNRNFVEAVIFQGKTYSTYVDPGNHARMITNFQEFEMRYDQTDFRNAWKYKYNWEGTFDATTFVSGVKIRCITTIPANGRTYAILYRYGSRGGGEEIVELDPVNGIRRTGSVHTLPASWLDKDGNVFGLEDGGVNGVANYRKDTRIGFDANGNPTYSPTVTVFTNNTQTGQMYPRLSGAKIRPWEVSSSNILAQFRGNGNDGGVTENDVYHFGGIDLSTGKFKFMTSLATFRDYYGEFPPDGAFDIGNGPPQYYGNVAVALERNFIWGYNGEFWKASQTNKWNHFYDNGLMIAQFGKTGPDYNMDPVTNKEFAGNAFCPSLIKEGNDYYMYHNDESVYGAAIRWKITGLDTIKEVVIPISSSYSRVPDQPAQGSLMEGLPYNVVLPASVSGWTRFPTTNNPGKWEVKSTFAEYRKYRKPNDIYVRFSNVNPSVASQSYVNRDLGNNSGLGNWTIAGILNYYDEFPNIDEEKLFLQILDNNNRIIARFYRKANFNTGGNDFYGNNTFLYNLPGNSRYTAKEQPFYIARGANNTITFQYADRPAQTVPIFDGASLIGNPKTLQAMFEFTPGNVNGYGKAIMLKGLTFNTVAT